MLPDDQPEPIRALLGLFVVLARRRIGQTRHADISAATGIGVTRLQRLAGTWRPGLECPALTIKELPAISGFAAGVLGVDARAVGRWLAGLADLRESEAVVSAIRRIAVAAVERRIELADVELPAALAELLGKT